ncbi:type 2 lanthipeptide synthetase LanM family protein [Sphaerisporangium melleum]|uniref:type 2 lanthipeptide synthetase LanM family protein n=1 Tax=Sphaerisporangium melleum TaxID=321316 RepID=UPI00166F1A6E|nr:type 2 lanthipeptide synthetase LanM family protein [Sphaerisporangium melleum]
MNRSSQCVTEPPQPPAPAGDAARPPAWNAALEAVPDLPEGSTGRTAGLSDALRPLVGHAADRLVAGAAGLDTELRELRELNGLGGLRLDSIRKRFAADLSARLTRIASRVLVFELNARRVRGELAGGTPAERFAHFVGQIGEGGGLVALLVDYPVLGRLLDQTADQAVRGGLELLTRFAGDRTHLRELVGADAGDLVEFTATGDTHHDGRAVAVLSLSGGAKVVYRPRPVEAHLRFAEVLGWLNERVPGLDLRTPRALCRDGYGWSEFVPAAPCADAAEVERFYLRAGALLALLYAVNAIDVHYENLVACAGQPVLVDVETLFHPALPMEASADPALTALRDSVQRTALLPKVMVGDQGALDISGLGGDKDGVYPFSTPVWEGDGTDTMRLVRGVARFTGGVNRPRLNGVDADPGDHVPSLLAGFRRAYDAIAAGREEFLCGPLARFAQAEVRVLLRPTRFYAELLTESTHPDVVRSAAERDAVFGVLDSVSAGDPARSAAAPAERADLWAGDIPCFSAKPGIAEIRDSGGRPLSWRPAQSGLDVVAAKLARMGAVDRDHQEWLIQASMAARVTARTGGNDRNVGNGRHEPGEPSDAPLQAMVPHPEALVAAARGIADRLCATAHREGRTVNWLGLEPLEHGQWSVMPLGGGLATGYLGVALFLAQASRATGISRYLDFARMAVEPLPRLLEQITAHDALLRAVGCGGFGGLGGIAYGLSQLGVLLGDGEVAGWVEPAVAAAGAAVTDEAPLDVHDGLAGCLAAMLAVRDGTGSAAAGRVAEACAERLTAAAPSAALPPGFAFGAAGVGWALVRNGPSLEGARLLTGAAAQVTEGGTWCHGRAGVRLALADAAMPGDTAGRPAADVPLGGHGLCHGETGRLEAMSALAKRGDTGAQRSLRRHAGRLLASLDTHGALCGTPRHAPTPGLLDGLAGIGHGLLRLALPERTASVLLLKPTVEGETRGL